MSKLVYLNNAATAWPRAPGVVEAVAETLREMPGEAGRSSGADHSAGEECRQQLAQCFQVEDIHRIIFTSNATTALNLAIGGLRLTRGDRVVTSVTEHNSVLRPLHHLKSRAGIEVVLIGANEAGDLDIAAAERALGRGARLLALNHISNVTGKANPVEPLFRLAKAAGALTLLDASQSMGLIPVHPRQLHADLVAFTGHKGLRGPPGTGGLWVAPEIELEQIIVGGTGTRSDSEDHPAEMPTRLEAGTPNLPALAGLAAALRWREQDGGASTAHQQRLTARLHSGLAEIPRVRLCGEASPAASSGILSFQIAGWDVEEAGYVLRESFGIICRTGLHCAPLIHAALGTAPQGTIRFSLSGCNSEEEVARALGAVRELAA